MPGPAAPIPRRPALAALHPTGITPRALRPLRQAFISPAPLAFAHPSPYHWQQSLDPVDFGLAWDLPYPLISEVRVFNTDNGGNYTSTYGPATRPPTEELHIDLPEFMGQHQEHWGPIHIVGSAGSIIVKDVLDAIDRYFQETHAIRVASIQNVVEGRDLDEIRRVDILHPYSFFDGLERSDTDPSGRWLRLRLKEAPPASTPAE
ncbi:hypothetical protein B0H17DRAFT_1211536 [Mycena rosella]|uniref:DUF6699 domain-containing protein n=1 Tax=Mycena rosella TaxID=1033263 RepID=A0AAD7CV47_MYCRO|nr:hypothetical protein B0H17DRAFT_1211536 [Mycena rosella]